MAIKLPPAMKDNAKCFIVRVGEGHQYGGRWNKTRVTN
jgi:hypothetical protein